MTDSHLIRKAPGHCPACGHKLSNDAIFITVDDELQWVDTRCAWALGYPDHRPIYTVRHHFRPPLVPLAGTQGPAWVREGS